MSKDLNSRQQNQISWINDQWQPRWYMWPDAKMAEAEWRFTANTRTRLQAGSSPTIGMSRVHNTRTFLSKYRYVTWYYTRVVRLSVCHVTTVLARCQPRYVTWPQYTQFLSNYRYVTWWQYTHVVKRSVCHVTTLKAHPDTPFRKS